jgi:hypothetical protein
MLYFSAGLFLASFFAIRKLAKNYFNEKVEQLLLIIDEENELNKHLYLVWSVDDDCEHICVEFL